MEMFDVFGVALIRIVDAAPIDAFRTDFGCPAHVPIRRFSSSSLVLYRIAPIVSCFFMLLASASRYRMPNEREKTYTYYIFHLLYVYVRIFEWKKCMATAAGVWPRVDLMTLPWYCLQILFSFHSIFILATLF